MSVFGSDGKVRERPVSRSFHLRCYSAKSSRCQREHGQFSSEPPVVEQSPCSHIRCPPCNCSSRHHVSLQGGGHLTSGGVVQRRQVDSPANLVVHDRRKPMWIARSRSTGRGSLVVRRKKAVTSRVCQRTGSRGGIKATASRKSGGAGRTIRRGRRRGRSRSEPRSK